ncbi:Clavaminate synthase-like protein [Stipitochalara longipes BDJ]|nr:Clavaminate synthase-like protein [Stipitochalara longipes BDJ]
MGIKSLPVVSNSLPTLHLDLLRSGDAAESKKLLDACRTHGFFYLDLTSDPTICRYWEEMLALEKEYFEQSLDIKMQDARGSDNTGYEPTGTEVGPKPMTVDGYESLKISRREFLNGEVELSTSMRDHTDFLFRFMREAHDLLMIMLERLSDEMGLQGPDRFENHHATPIPSLTNLALLRYPKHDNEYTESSVGHNKHTDIGSLTFLLCKQWGLQILSPDTKTWAFVKPRPLHAVINVGDSLRFTSGEALASVVHRVIPMEEKQLEDRYSIAYFLRVGDDVRLKDANGRLWSAKEWHDYKFDAFRTPTIANGMDILTGMMEENDVLISHAVAKSSVAV